MFNQNPFTSQRSVFLPLPLGQGMILGFLERRLTIFMEFCQALITSIGQNPNMLRNLSLTIFEELKVVLASIGKGRGHNFDGLLIGDQLRFLGVVLLFAAVMPFLAFFGRSIGCSLTSTSTISKTVSLG